VPAFADSQTWKWVRCFAGRDDDELKAARPGRSLAPDACRQCRRGDRSFFYKLTREPYVPYIHLLVDYHFGFTKRALIGAALSAFFPKISVWHVFALSGVVWLVTTGLFLKLFQRTFGLCDQHLVGS